MTQQPLQAAPAKADLAVVHSTHIWLAQTMSWQYTQIQHLPPHILNYVVCDTTENLDQFPARELLSADRDAWLWRTLGKRFWQMEKRRQRTLLQRCIHANNAQIVHSHFGSRGWENLDNLRHTGVRHVVTFYGYDVSRLPEIEPQWRSRYADMFAAADRMLCEGPHLGESLAALGCPPEKITVQHLGVDLDRIPFRPRRWFPGETLQVLMAGSFLEKKGIPYAIEALGRLKKKVDLQITLIGDSNRQPRSEIEKARILQALSDHGLVDRTRVLGYQPYEMLLAEGYASHVFLSPSVTASDGDTEGGAPVTIIEMAAAGMPVVTSRHCDIPQIIRDGDTGLLADEKNVDELEARLLWLIENHGSWESMARRARTHIEQEFNAAVQGSRLAAIYESVV